MLKSPVWLALALGGCAGHLPGGAADRPVSAPLVEVRAREVDTRPEGRREPASRLPARLGEARSAAHPIGRVPHPR